MSHTGAANGFHQRFFNHAVFDVERQFASALLGSAPTNTVRKTADVGNLFGFDPFTFFGNRGRFVLSAFANAAHILYFGGAFFATHLGLLSKSKSF